MLRVSAPGKTILMGEHAAVYGHPAVVAAIDRRLTVDLERGTEPGVRLDLPQLGIDTQISWRALRAEGDACRAAWEDYHADPTPKRYQALSSDDPARVARLALAEAARAIDLSDGQPDLVLRIHSDIPVGAGFGSSAAAAVAVVGALFAWQGVEDEPERLARAALEVERRQHGTPSGVDSRAVQLGGLLWVTRRDDGGLDVESIVPGDGAVLDAIAVYNTGTPAESTGRVVSAVRDLREADMERIDRVLADMAAATRAFRAQLERPLADAAAVADAVARFEAGLETLGVVPAAVRDTIRVLERAGAAAKISGAGALTGAGAGSLLVYDAGVGARASIARYLASYSRLGVRLGASGVRC